MRLDCKPCRCPFSGDDPLLIITNALTRLSRPCNQCHTAEERMYFGGETRLENVSLTLNILLVAVISPLGWTHCSLPLFSPTMHAFSDGRFGALGRIGGESGRFKAATTSPTEAGSGVARKTSSGVKVFPLFAAQGLYAWTDCVSVSSIKISDARTKLHGSERMFSQMSDCFVEKVRHGPLAIALPCRRTHLIICKLYACMYSSKCEQALGRLVHAFTLSSRTTT